MSYNPLRNEDSLSELFSTMNDFNIVSKHLMDSRGNPAGFTIWLSKCRDVDKRSLYFFLKDKKESFSEEEWMKCVSVVPQLGKERPDISEFLDDAE